MKTMAITVAALLLTLSINAQTDTTRSKKSTNKKGENMKKNNSDPSKSSNNPNDRNYPNQKDSMRPDGNDGTPKTIPNQGTSPNTNSPNQGNGNTTPRKEK